MSYSVEIEARFPPKLECLFDPSRYKVLHGGRGGAKSWGVGRALLIEGAQKPIRVLCARELQNSIRDSVHKLLSDQISALNLDSFFEIQNTTIKGRNGTEFSFEGLRHNVTKIKSYEGVDRVWVEEAESVSKASWNILIPTIRKDGSEIWITFNPEFEDDETYERFVLHPPKSAVVVELNFRDNPWFPDVLELERQALKERDPDAYDHVWEGKCRKWLDGAIYAKELRKAYDENRICSVSHDPVIPVFTAWDLGRTDDTAIWWYQLVAGEIHVIESYAYSGGDPAHFATQILGKQVSIDIIAGNVVVDVGEDIDGLEHRRAYRYETHWLPHDARAKTLAAHGKSTQEQLQYSLGFGHVMIAPALGREDGIKAARAAFAKCYFDKNNAADGLKALRKYQRELQNDAVSLKPNPKHDWSSHYADAFRGLAVVWQEESNIGVEPQASRDAYGAIDDDEDDNWKAA